MKSSCCIVHAVTLFLEIQAMQFFVFDPPVHYIYSVLAVNDDLKLMNM